MNESIKNGISGYGCNYGDCDNVNCSPIAVMSHIRLRHTFERSFTCYKCDYKTVSQSFLTQYKLKKQ